jgi:hypothetical protein
MFVDHGIPNFAGTVIARIRWTQDFTLKTVLQFLDEGVIQLCLCI